MALVSIDPNAFSWGSMAEEEVLAPLLQGLMSV